MSISSEQPIFHRTSNAGFQYHPETGDKIYNRVPQVTWDFWIVKLLAVTVGETAADFLATTLGFGLNNTSLVMGALLIALLALQFNQQRYIPWIYWTTVVLVSVVGTLITDNLIDNLGWSLMSTTVMFTAILAAVFAVWYAVERTLSIHSIYTFRREAFYWAAILFTFALGTSAGDQAAEAVGLGYFGSGIMYAVIIGAITAAFYGKKMNGILAFWLAYIITRPMGASFGDLLSQPSENGGLALGTVITSFIFLVGIAATVFYMTRSRDGLEIVPATELAERK
tara:strand:+ start:5603 stop:6451 length:849 start_codon:yes stop_codon:yes gene_type:complete